MRILRFLNSSEYIKQQLNVFFILSAILQNIICYAHDQQYNNNVIIIYRFIYICIYRFCPQNISPYQFPYYTIYSIIIYKKILSLTVNLTHLTMQQSMINQINNIKSTKSTRVTRSQYTKNEYVKNLRSENFQDDEEEGMKCKGKEWSPGEEDDSNICDQDTNTRVLVIPKMVYDFDDEQTRKNPLPTKAKISTSKEQRFSKQLKPVNQIQIKKQSSQDFSTARYQQKQKPTKNQDPNLNKTIHKNLLLGTIPLNKQPNKIPQIPYNPKAESILLKKPLRQRFQSLLSEEQLLPISYDHQQILKRMEYIDRTIQFMITHRSMKVLMFQTIRKTLIQSSNIHIQYETLRQLLFLNEECYSIQWRKISESGNRYDLKMSIDNRNGYSIDLRRMQMRKKIVKYLLEKQAEFLIQVNSTKTFKSKWHPRFEYQKIVIPMKSLPIHPHQQTTDLRAFPDSEINKLQNPYLKSLLKNKKQQSQVKSLSKASVADMIFSRMPASQISEQLLTVIKQKQRKNLQSRTNFQKKQQKMQNQVILKVIREVFIIYMSKNVSNIFKVTLLEMLNKRLKFKDDTIEKCLNRIIEMSKEQREDKIQYLKEIESARKLKVIQINRHTYKQIEQYYEQLVKKSKEQDLFC